MPVLDAGNIINLNDSRLDNRGRRLSIGVLIELEKLPADERQRVMNRSMSAKQRAKAERSIQELANSPIAALGKQIQEFVDRMPKVPALPILPKIQVPKFTSDFLPALRDYKTKGIYTGYVYQPTLAVPAAARSNDEVIIGRLDSIDRHLQNLQAAQVPSSAPVRNTKPKLMLTPESYRPKEKELLLGDTGIKFQRSTKEAGVLQVLFGNPWRMQHKWDYSHFFEAYQKELRNADVRNWKQVRNAITRIRTKIVQGTKKQKIDIFIIDIGFRINPKYLPK